MSSLSAADACRVIERFIQNRDATIQSKTELHQSAPVMAGNPSNHVERRVKQVPSLLLRRITDLPIKINRRNQVLYCLGHCENDEFGYEDIERLVRQRFPKSNMGLAVGVTSALAEMANDKVGILKSNKTKTAYMLQDPILRTCLRNMFRCVADSEMVEMAPCNEQA